MIFAYFENDDVELNRSLILPVQFFLLPLIAMPKCCYQCVCVWVNKVRLSGGLGPDNTSKWR
jgi:hypothetical protein